MRATARPGDGGDQIGEFKAMVKALHRAGIEVILDVVYNHTAEGNQLGPTLSFRGIDNSTYYRLVPGQPRYYMDYTGTGNTLNVRHPQVLKLIMDSLRYWVQEMHVDGFRFDLAAALARELHEVDRLSAFFDIINQDPVISQVKLIAEPWDVGEGGYQVGKFPPLWAEWNGKYRDVVRRYWKGDDGQLAELGYRLTGSSDLYQRDGRHPTASINFVTAHDGFTLNDLVSYDDKHNQANGEDNRDGTNENYSCNYGAEGPAEDAEIVETRERQKRNFLLTLFCSQGVPMMCGGDEIGRTQRGNNNAYAQDNAISWFDWHLDKHRECAARIHAPADPCAPPAPQPAPAQILPGPGHSPRQDGAAGERPCGARHHLAASGRRGDDGGGVAGGMGALHRLRAERAHAGRCERRGRADPRRDVHDAAESAPRADPILHAAPRGGLGGAARFGAPGKEGVSDCAVRRRLRADRAEHGAAAGDAGLMGRGWQAEACPTSGGGSRGFRPPLCRRASVAQGPSLQGWRRADIPRGRTHAGLEAGRAAWKAALRKRPDREGKVR